MSGDKNTHLGHVDQFLKNEQGVVHQQGDGRIIMKEHFLIKEVYTNRDDTEQFDLVMVTAEDSSDIAGLSLNSDGTADGFELIAKENIFLTEYGTPYCNDVESAVDPEKLSESAFSFKQECNVRKQFIAHCIEEALFVQMELCGSELIDVEGKILSDDGCTLEMTILSEDGVPAGHASVDAASVTRLFVPYDNPCQALNGDVKLPDTADV